MVQKQEFSNQKAHFSSGSTRDVKEFRKKIPKKIFKFGIRGKLILKILNF